MTPLEFYNNECLKGTILPDEEQNIAIHYLQNIYDKLIEEHTKRLSWQKLFRKPALIEGAYLWGGVGIGKTFLMDCFYSCLPFSHKMRMHFFQFMQRVHHDLTVHQGKSDPLNIIAKELAKETIVICFDEFLVWDITDAMLLGKLLEALFANGVTLIATSNTAPENLYKNGLQRSRFLPAIGLLKKNLKIIHLSTLIDYRLRHLAEAGVFYTPLDSKAAENMQKTFDLFAGNERVDELPIIVNGRTIKINKKTNNIIWFDFLDICSIPRSQNDYLSIAERYKTIFISDIPAFDANSTDRIYLFIALVDVFYDAHVQLVISAAEELSELYKKGCMVLEYARTHSRLLEMQSKDYFMNEED